MYRLRISISFWASTLVDEICQIASKDKAMVKANLIPLVFFRRHGSATSAASASLRPFGITCITLAGTLFLCHSRGALGQIGARFCSKHKKLAVFSKMCLLKCLQINIGHFAPCTKNIALPQGLPQFAPKSCSKYRKIAQNPIFYRWFREKFGANTSATSTHFLAPKFFCTKWCFHAPKKIFFYSKIISLRWLYNM